MVMLAAIALSAAAYYVSIGLGGFWPAVWIAPIPILVVAARRRAMIAALLGFAAYFLGSLNLLTFLAQVMPLPILVALLAAVSLISAASVLSARLAIQGLPVWIAPFAFPFTWTGLEFALSLISPHGTALSLAYTQTDVLPLLQIASITGLWGLTFLVTLGPSAIATAWVRRAPRALAPAALIFLVVFTFGAYRLRHAPSPAPVRVGLAATDENIATAAATRDPVRAVAVALGYADRIDRLAAGGARVIVLPEKFVGITWTDSPAVLSVLADAARSARATVVAGVNRVDTPARNVALVFRPDGGIETEYEKHHLLPGAETGYRIGTTPGFFAPPVAAAGSPFPVDDALWGVQICKDLDFTEWSRRYSQQGARILAVPAWDFVRDARLHARMALMRGVENGFALARSAEQGLLTLSDAYGRIVAETSSGAERDALLVGDLAPGPGATFYTQWGDWFGWLALCAAAVLLMWAGLMGLG
jgi:apolipoprotein N-acyltransferase